MTSVRLSKKLDDKLNQLALVTQRSKSFFIKEALGNYLEDMEDVYIALERVANPDAEYLTTEELLKQIDQ